MINSNGEVVEEPFEELFNIIPLKEKVGDYRPHCFVLNIVPPEEMARGLWIIDVQEVAVGGGVSKRVV